MPQGLQVFDENGNMTLDVTDRLTRVLGEFQTGKVSGSITDSNLSSGIPWYIIKNSSDGRGYKYAPFLITFTSNGASWTFGSGTIVSKNITYGVY